MSTVATPDTAPVVNAFFSLEDLEKEPIEKVPDLITNLIGKGTINLLIGDSGLGKTALGMQLGIALAGGMEFLGMEVEQGPVLYIDAESPKEGFKQTALNLQGFLGLTSKTPFISYNQQWDFRPNRPLHWPMAIQEGIEKVKPVLVIVDPLRAVWPLAETTSDETMRMIDWQRKISQQHGCAWLITHHIRKVNRDYEPADLLKDPHAWLQEAAGSRALITSADTRIGVCGGTTGGADVFMSGYTRLRGPLPSRKLVRAYDEDGIAVGYKLLNGTDALTPKALTLYAQLPSVFRLSDVKQLASGSSTAQGFLNQFLNAGLLQRDPVTKLFHKVTPA